MDKVNPAKSIVVDCIIQSASFVKFQNQFASESQTSRESDSRECNMYGFDTVVSLHYLSPVSPTRQRRSVQIPNP